MSIMQSQEDHNQIAGSVHFGRYLLKLFTSCQGLEHSYVIFRYTIDSKIWGTQYYVDDLSFPVLTR